MSRYLNNSTVTASVVAVLLIGLFVFQATFPTLAYADTSTDTTGEVTVATESVEDPPAPEVIVEVAAAEETEETPAEETPLEIPDPADVPTGTSSITTGDATAGLLLESEVNTTEVDTTAASSTGSSTPEAASLVLDPETPATDIAFENAATTTNNATSAAATGENNAYSSTASITTGDAIAYADILNVVNTNIVDSEGLVAFINDSLGYQDFDVRTDFELAYGDFETAQSTPACSLEACLDGTTTVNSTNTAVIDNNLLVLADTGGNSAAGNQANVTTGNAYASASVINVANTNITDSQYLLLTFNNFSDFAGDIILPSSDFFDQFLATGGGSTPSTVTTNNSANVTNTVAAEASSGGNTAAGNTTNITTGNAVATADTTNLINQTMVGGGSFSMLIRVHGTWTGSISGLPDGMTWRETPQGIEIIADTTGAGRSTSAGSVTSNNHASINNNVQVYALTGDNQAAGDSATINTGNAYADAAIMNIANTNIVGSNWSNLIFTIYGNWSGNLTFGQPNLWLGVRAESADQPMMPGSLVDYTFTIFNQGDSKARGVRLDSLFEATGLAFRDANGNPGQASWNVGDLAAGETKEVTYRAEVGNTLDRNVVSAIPLTARVTSRDRDADTSDNEDTITIFVGEKYSHTASAKDRFLANFDITKTADKTVTKNGDEVMYTVTFYNRGGQLYDAMLVDQLTDEAGKVMLEQSWPLGEIKNWETVTVQYAVVFDENFAPGTYTNSAQLIGFTGSVRPRDQRPYESSIVTEVVRHNLPDPLVLGASTLSCPEYITEYLRSDQDNPVAEVVKLQNFLNVHLGTNLLLNGYYGPDTEAAVREFQQLYRSEILDPWGITNDTGIVLYTTRRKINELYCGGTREFTLQPQEHEVIQYFRSRWLGA